MADQEIVIQQALPRRPHAPSRLHDNGGEDLFGQAPVVTRRPAREPILKIPLRLAMTDEDESAHTISISNAALFAYLLHISTPSYRG